MEAGASTGELDGDTAVFALETYCDGFPHGLFARLRREDPVHWCHETTSPEYPWAREPGPGFWAVTRHGEVAQVLRDPATFSSNVGTTLLVEPPIAAFLELQRQMLINLDPPRHTRIRLIVNRAFTPRSVERLREAVRTHARQIVDLLEPATEIDFVATVAAELPLLVLCDVLGVARHERDLLFRWSNQLIGATDPEYGVSGIARFDAACREMFAFADALTEEKRRRPGDDVWSMIVNAEVDGQRLSTSELRMFWQLLAIAGNETTRNALTGGVMTLDAHRDQLDLLVADPALGTSAVEEILRWVAPVNRFRRTATRSTRIGRTVVGAGDKVVVFYPSANRDEAVFRDPDEFDIRRDPNPHLTFGVGPHFCLGANLARVEILEMMGALLRRFPNLTVAGMPVRMRSTFINGVRHLPVHLGHEQAR